MHACTAQHGLSLLHVPDPVAVPRRDVTGRTEWARFGTERQPVVREDVLHVGVKPHGTDKLFDCSNAGASSTFSRGRAAFRSVSHIEGERPDLDDSSLHTRLTSITVSSHGSSHTTHAFSGYSSSEHLRRHCMGRCWGRRPNCWWRRGLRAG